jgi:hypothetical protein
MAVVDITIARELLFIISHVFLWPRVNCRVAFPKVAVRWHSHLGNHSQLFEHGNGGFQAFNGQSEALSFLLSLESSGYKSHEPQEHLPECFGMLMKLGQEEYFTGSSAWCTLSSRLEFEKHSSILVLWAYRRRLDACRCHSL